MEKMDMRTKDIVSENVGKLKELFPEVFTEGKVDFEALKEVLGEFVDDQDERYNFTWNGKSKARMLAQEPSTGTLRPCKNESVDFDSTQNIFIEGDNLEVLKLLQKSYHKKVKMIYIDPPYNTGNDFVYKDDFKDNIKNYKEITGQVDSNGRNLRSNLETSGRYHTDWLNMMYPRLKLARNLLKDDGVIFVSIDDNEVHNLRLIMNELFGEENFVNVISAKMKNIAGASGGGEDKKLKKNIEFILVYVKNYELFESFFKVYSFTKINELLDLYRQENISWKYTSVITSFGKKSYLLSTKDGDGNEIKIYKRNNIEISSIQQLMKEYSLTESEVYVEFHNRIFTTAMPQSSIRKRILKVIEKEEKSDIYSIEYIPKTGKNKGQIYEQFYKGEKLRLISWLKDVSEIRDGVVYKKDLIGTLWDKINLNNLTKEGGMKFENGKKPVELLIKLIQIGSNKSDIILDFFAGSCTTAHAVMDLNKEDGGNRKYIMVQLPEPCDEKSEAYKAGYKTIADIGKERIRRVINKIKDANVSSLLKEKQDLGFKVFKLDSSNIKPWEVDFDLDNNQLEAFVENIKPDRCEEDILYEVLIKYGLDLTLPITEHAIAGQKVFDIGMGALIICLSDDISLEAVEGIAKLKDKLSPEVMRVVFKDSGFKDDVVKTNAVQILKTAGIVDVRSL